MEPKSSGSSRKQKVTTRSQSAEIPEHEISPRPGALLQPSVNRSSTYGSLGGMGPWQAEVANANEKASGEQSRRGEANLALAVRDLESSEEDTAKLSDRAKAWWHCIFTVGPIMVAIIWTLVGVLVLVWGMGWQHITAFYVITQVVTTIGYGDHTPISQAGKLFVSFYAIVTILLIGTLLTELMSSMVQKNLSRVEGMIRHITGDSSPAATTVIYKLGAAFLFFATFILIGTVFFGTYEACTCSYGIDRIEGCVSGKRCVETGGVVKSWVDCFYMSVTTLTTCGFGDDLPLSKHGRIFLIPWCFVGTISMANFAAKFGEFLWSQREEEAMAQRPSEEMFLKVEAEQPGKFSKHEFREFALLKFNLISEDSLGEIDYLFNSLRDRSDQGEHVSFDEILQHFKN